MDARHNLPKNTVLFLTLALLAIAPWHAQAQTLSVSNSNVSVSSTGYQSVNVSGSEDGAANFITFSVAVSYQSTNVAWLSTVVNNASSCGSPAGTFVTPSLIQFGLSGCQGGSLLPNTTYTAIVTLTPTAPPAAASAAATVINVSYYSGSSGGQTLTPSASTVNINAAPGTIGFGSFTLSTTSGAAVSYNIANPTVNWLTFTQNQSGTVTSGNALVVGLEGNATNLTTSQSTSLTVTYNGSSTLTIQVNFTVGSGTGNGSLTFGQSTFNFSYNSGGSLPNAQSTTITNSSASTYTFSVNTSPSTWLAVNGQVLANGNTSGATLIGTPITLQLDSFATQLGTGSYTAIVTITDSNNNTGTITVGLSVNGGSTGQLTVSPNPVTLNAGFGSSIVQVNVSVTSNTSGTLTASITGAGLSLPISSGTGGATQTVTAGVPVTIIVQGNPSGLTSNTYTGSLLLQENNATISQSYSVSFTVGSGNGGGTPNGTIAAPTSLNFFYESGQSTSAGQLQQQITVAGTGAFTVSPVTINNSSVAWLTVNTTNGTAPSLVTVYASPTVGAGLTPGTYTGSFTVTQTSTGTTQTINATITVTSGTPLLVANPGVVNVTCDACATLPTQFVQVVATDGTNLPISVTSTSTGSWLSASVSSTGSTTPTSVQYTITPGSLANGLYTGNIAVSGGALTNNIPVVLLVQGSSSTNGGNLTLTTSSLTFNALLNGAAPQTQTLGVSATSTTNFTASTSTTNGGSWLSISPSGNLNTNQTLLVSANQTGLALGTYSGSISLVSGGITQTVGVTMVVGTTTNVTGNVTVNPSNLTNFSYQVGGTVPQSQQITVNSASGTAGLPFTAAASSTGNWLAVSPTSANTSATVTVSLNTSALASLSAGTYSGNVTLSPTGGTVVTLPISLSIIAAPTVSATPTSLSFSYQSGGNTPSPSSISVSGSTTGLSFSATSTILSGSNWLSITPSSGTTPGTVTVNVNPSSLAAGTYNGTVTVSGSGGATGTTTVNISLTVTAPLPTITAVVNGASFLASSSVSPGEIVTIGGTAIGPQSPATLTLDSTGKVSTSIGGVIVLFNGYAAPLIYVSSTQINCVVPYEIAGVISPYVQVKFLGQTSNAWSLQPAVAVPAIFTANSQGTGPGAILNSDNSYNSQKAAAKGSTIQVFMTGEGATTPGGVDGKLTTVNNSGVGPLTPAPLLPVSALVGGQPAQVQFFGEAPTLVAGVLQVNIVIPANAPSGNLSLSISVGTISTQQGVTVAVQ